MADPSGSPLPRILIVEDEMFISMLLEDLLTELGYRPAGPVVRLDEALAAARSEAIDAALLDVNLNGKETYAVADILAGRGIPFVFATGYGAGGIPERYRHRPILAKPFRRDDLARVLAQALAATPR
jgi:CheY-like chemotaxis protein